MNYARKISLIGVLTALAIVLAVLEQYIPIHALLPLPGIKLGIANVVTLVALKQLDFKSSLLIVVVRCCVVALLFGTPVSFAMSVSGGLFSWLVMAILNHNEKWFSIFGISIAGATFHNIGQVLCACIILRSYYIIGYLPILLLSAFLTGALNALLASGSLRFFKKI